MGLMLVKPEGKISPGRPRRRLKDNSKMDLKETGYDTDSTHLVQDRGQCRTLVNTVMNLWVP
jgi:hypothetical protein